MPTVARADGLEQHLSAVCYDAVDRCLISGYQHLHKWGTRSQAGAAHRSHASRVSRVVYAPAYNLVVSADHSSTQSAPSAY